MNRSVKYPFANMQKVTVVKLYIVVFCLFTCWVNAQTPKKVAWDYPVKQGTEAWNRTRTHAERVAVCQIPENLLSSISTKDLAEICLKYPVLFETLYSSNTYDSGLDRLFEEFNGIAELFKRSEVSKALLNQYQEKMQNLSYLEGKSTDTQKGLFILDIAVIELLLSRYQSPDDKNNENYIVIMQFLITGYEKKLLYPKSFGGLSFGINLFARTKILIKLDKQNLEKIPEKDINLIFSRGEFDEPTMRNINELSYQIIKK